MAAPADSQHLFGEHSPRWLSLAFAAIGTTIAAAAAWLWLDARVSPPALPAPTVVAEVPAASPPAAPAVAPNAAPTVAPAEAPPAAASSAPPAAPASAAGLAAASGPAAAAPPAIDCPAAVELFFARAGVQPLAPPDAGRLAELREFLARHAEARLVVSGHADATGADEENLVLSYRRAKAVEALLARAGIAPQQVAARAFGRDAPRAGERAESAANRRVELRVEQAGRCAAAAGEQTR